MNKSNLQTYDKPIELGKSLDGHRSRRAFRISDKYVAKLGLDDSEIENIFDIIAQEHPEL